MKSLGIAQVNNRVAYRLDCAEKIMIVNKDHKGRIQLHTVNLSETNTIRRVQQIIHLGIDTLICGSAGKFACHMLQYHGIQVIGRVIGTAHDALNLYLKGELHEGTVIPPPAQKTKKTF